MLTLGLGRSSTRVMPSVGSGRYWPGPGMEMLLKEESYQVIRPIVTWCSLIRPDFLAIDSSLSSIRDHQADDGLAADLRRGTAAQLPVLLVRENPLDRLRIEHDIHGLPCM